MNESERGRYKDSVVMFRLLSAMALVSLSQSPGPPTTAVIISEFVLLHIICAPPHLKLSHTKPSTAHTPSSDNHHIIIVNCSHGVHDIKGPV